MAITKRNIGQLLLEKGILKEEDYQTALEVQKQTTQRIDRILVDMGMVEENVVLQAKAEVMGVDYVNLRTTRVDPAATQKVPHHILERHNALPIRMDGNRLTVAMVDPTDIVALDDLSAAGDDDPLDPVLSCRFQHVVGADDVGRQQYGHEVGFNGERGQMDDGIHAVNSLVHGVAVGQVADLHFQARHCLARRPNIEAAHAVAAVDQLGNDVAADAAGCSGDQDFFCGHLVLPFRSFEHGH